MKTEIKSSGILTIKPETELEVYALRMWCRENITNNGELTTQSMIIEGKIEIEKADHR